MAWVTEYDMTWRDSRGDTGSIYLQRDGGTYQQGLNLVFNSLEITRRFDGWDSDIMKMNCVFSVVNDLADFYELLPLLTISNGQIRVVVTQYNATSSGGTKNIFIGFLNCEAISEVMLNKSEIRFTASGLLSKLENLYPSSLNTLQSISLIDLIDNCLTLTETSYPIRVNCSLVESTVGPAVDETLFNRTSILTELYWSNNVEKVPALEILSSILRSFNCYLYWYEECWYIEHYDDIDNFNSTNEKDFVEYTSGVSYEYGNGGSVQTIQFDSIYDVHDPVDCPQIGGKQGLSVIPGMRLIEINLNQKQFFNLMNGNLADNEQTTSSAPTPEWRNWLFYKDGLIMLAEYAYRYKNISNCMRRSFYEYSIGAKEGNGISTKFRLTLEADTSLTVKWKYSPMSMNFVEGSSDLGDYEVTFYYWVAFRYNDEGAWHFLGYIESSDTWEDAGSGLPADNLLTVNVPGSNFDSELLTTEVAVTIPIGETLFNSTGEDDISITFGIGHEFWDDYVISAPKPSTYATFGDVQATISQSEENNQIKGELNTDFLDKRTYSVDLFDSGWSYRNVSCTGTTFSNRTDSWGYSGSFTDTLPRLLLASKFRLYNIARQRMKIDYFTNTFFRPLCMWQDNKQSNKQLVMLGDTYKPESRIHTVELYEFDDTTEINLI